MFDQAFQDKLKKQTPPAQGLVAGDRVRLNTDSGDYDGFNYIAAGIEGTVLGFATPDIQKRQIWPEESYYVRLDCDTEDSIGRVLNRERLDLLRGGAVTRPTKP